MAVATSGHYERFVIINGEKYAHIIDPRNGYPVKGMAGVTILASTATEADAMSTAMFVMGAEEAKDVLKKLPDCHVLFIPDEQPLRIIVTPGMNKLFKPDKGFIGQVTIMDI